MYQPYLADHLWRRGNKLGWKVTFLFLESWIDTHFLSHTHTKKCSKSWGNYYPLTAFEDSPETGVIKVDIAV